MRNAQQIPNRSAKVASLTIIYKVQLVKLLAMLNFIIITEFARPVILNVQFVLQDQQFVLHVIQVFFC